MDAAEENDNRVHDAADKASPVDICPGAQRKARKFGAAKGDHDGAQDLPCTNGCFHVERLQDLGTHGSRLVLAHGNDRPGLAESTTVRSLPFQTCAGTGSSKAARTVIKVENP